ncbi:MAG: hypothetical protein LBO65_04920, partial [Spirochaetaceae bacterium]|nr:hypothetical protein [Spirochaetaceae bacterium]
MQKSRLSGSFGSLQGIKIHFREFLCAKRNKLPICLIEVPELDFLGQIIWTLALKHDTRVSNKKREIVALHEFCHFAACIYAYIADKDKFIRKSGLIPRSSARGGSLKHSK